jgi:hypothetical protein
MPMSDKAKGFVRRSIESVQAGCFLRDLPRMRGRFRYPAAGLNACAGTIVLFQYKARIIASGVFVRDERFEKPVRGCAGAMHFEPNSFRTFTPVDVTGMRAVWPGFRAFGHVKQHLNPTCYPAFVRRLKNVTKVVGILT